MSKKKVLKVDKLVIRADKISVEVDGKEVELEELRKNTSTVPEPEPVTASDPWDFFGPGPEGEMEEDRVEEDGEEAPSEEDEAQGWSWI